MNKKQRKEIRDKISVGLMYLCDPEIKDQWGACNAHADIIISDVIEDLLMAEFRRGYNQCLKHLKFTGEKYQGLYL